MTEVSIIDSSLWEVLKVQERERYRELLLSEREPAKQPVTPWTHVQSAHQRELTTPIGLGYQSLIKELHFASDYWWICWVEKVLAITSNDSRFGNNSSEMLIHALLMNGC